MFPPPPGLSSPAKASFQQWHRPSPASATKPYISGLWAQLGFPRYISLHSISIPSHTALPARRLCLSLSVISLSRQRVAGTRLERLTETCSAGAARATAASGGRAIEVTASCLLASADSRARGRSLLVAGGGGGGYSGGKERGRAAGQSGKGTGRSRHPRISASTQTLPAIHPRFPLRLRVVPLVPRPGR